MNVGHVLNAIFFWTALVCVVLNVVVTGSLLRRAWHRFRGLTFVVVNIRGLPADIAIDSVEASSDGECHVATHVLTTSSSPAGFSGANGGGPAAGRAHPGQASRSGRPCAVSPDAAASASGPAA